MLTKAYLIDSIVEMNPTAQRAWLGQFSSGEVREYLERLRYAAAPRHGAGWQRSRPSIADAEVEGQERRAA